MKIDFVPPEQFFEILYDNTEFCDGVGRVMLSASKLETNLRKYLKAKNIVFNPKSTLGSLVTKLKENDLLTQNGQMLFHDLVLVRNYLAHSLYDLFTKEIEKTILLRDNLYAEDIDIFIYRAYQLAEDFLHFAEIVAKAETKAGKLL